MHGTAEYLNKSAVIIVDFYLEPYNKKLIYNSEITRVILLKIIWQLTFSAYIIDFKLTLTLTETAKDIVKISLCIFYILKRAIIEAIFAKLKVLLEINFA